MENQSFRYVAKELGKLSGDKAVIEGYQHNDLEIVVLNESVWYITVNRNTSKGNHGHIKKLMKTHFPSLRYLFDWPKECVTG